MSVSAETVANRFLQIARRNGRNLSNMQLQKLVYIAHGYTLAIDGVDNPLIYNDVRAWQYGPVFPKLYKKLRKYGSGNVTDLLPSDENESLNSNTEEIVSAVWEAYGSKTGGMLSTLTHKEGTPWSLTYKKEPFAIIPNSLIAAHYKAMLEGASNGSC